MYCRSVRLQLVVQTTYRRETADDAGGVIVQSAPGVFRSQIDHVVRGQPIDMADVLRDLNAQADTFTSQGSGYTLDSIDKVTAIVTRYEPVSIAGYVPTPPRIEAKRAIINVQNFGDEKCFVWSILAALYPPNIIQTE